MAINYAKQVTSPKSTPQSEKIPGSSQVANNAGGFAWAVDDWTRLDRFLALGSEGGTYYVGQKKLTQENAEAVIRCLKADGARTVARIVEISDQGRAPKNDPALFALALCAKLGDETTRAAAYKALPKVARIGTHLFHFADYCDTLGGWGSGTIRAFQRWYNDMATDRLALQAVKYQQRDGWSHRDLLRKSHVKAASPAHDAIYRYIVAGMDGLGDRTVKGSTVTKSEARSFRAVDAEMLPQVILAFEKAKVLKSKADVGDLCKLIVDARLPHECIPTEAKQFIEVWEAMLPEMGLTALIRNLGKMTEIGLLAQSDARKLVVDRLADADVLRKARIHPLSILVAMKTYAQGHGDKGSLTWQPEGKIIDALDGAFYKSFKFVEPTSKRHLLALDISGSMSMDNIAGMPGISPCIGSAAMALITANVENDCEFVGFTTTLSKLAISPRQRLDDVVRYTQGLTMGGTDCSQPMLWAMKNKVAVDAFCIFTDSETYAGTPHPSQALKQYRDKMGINAKLIVVGMVSTEFTIADPNDKNMLDVVGFDTATPSIISDFVR